MRVLKPSRDIQETSIKERKVTDLSPGEVFVGKIFESGGTSSNGEGVFLVITHGQDKYLVNLKNMQVCQAVLVVIDEQATESMQLEVGVTEAAPHVAAEETQAEPETARKRYSLA